MLVDAVVDDMAVDQEKDAGIEAPGGEEAPEADGRENPVVRGVDPRKRPQQVGQSPVPVLLDILGRQYVRIGRHLRDLLLVARGPDDGHVHQRFQAHVQQVAGVRPRGRQEGEKKEEEPREAYAQCPDVKKCFCHLFLCAPQGSPMRRVRPFRTQSLEQTQFISVFK